MLDACPLRQFEVWLEQAVQAGLEDPTAMVLATIDQAGLPWQRIVLLKGLSHGGFVFYTNHASAKAEAMARESTNDKVAVDLWNRTDDRMRVGCDFIETGPMGHASGLG